MILGKSFCFWSSVSSSVKWEQSGWPFWLWHNISNSSCREARLTQCNQRRRCWKGCYRPDSLLPPSSSPSSWESEVQRLGNWPKVTQILFIMMTYFNVVFDSINFLMWACMHAKSLWSCPTHSDPMDCSLPGSAVHAILQARILEWVAMLSSRRSSRPRDQTLISYVSYIGRQVLYH